MTAPTTKPGMNDTLPCPSLSAQLRHKAKAERCFSCFWPTGWDEPALPAMPERHAPVPGGAA